MSIAKLGHIFSLILKKNSPKLLTIGGAGLIVVGVVSAVKATPKALQIKATMDRDLKDIHETVEKINSGEAQLKEGETYTTDDYHHDLAITYSKYTKMYITNYIPSATLIGLGIAAMAASSIVLKKRNIALSTGFAALQAAYNRYQDKVKGLLGTEKAQNLKYEAVDVTEMSPAKDGKKAKVIHHQDINKVIVGEVSPYAKFFDENSRYFFHQDDGNAKNIEFLKKQQCYANDRLKRKGYLFLNDVYDLLDIPNTQVGSIVGWIYNPRDERSLVDFDLYNITRDGNRRFINGESNAVLLDFNVTGKIAKYI